LLEKILLCQVSIKEYTGILNANGWIIDASFIVTTGYRLDGGGSISSRDTRIFSVIRSVQTGFGGLSAGG
jgi:hypothetical protein